VLRCVLPILLVAASVVGCGTVNRTDPFSPNEPPRLGQPPVEAVTSGLASTFRGFFGLLGWSGSLPPNYWTRLLLDPEATAEQRRAALAGLSDEPEGRTRDYQVALYAPTAADEAERAGVRATAVRALNRARAGDETALLVDLLDADAAEVRLEAAKALANLPTADAVVPLLARAEDVEEETDVRLAAVAALRPNAKVAAGKADLLHRLAALVEADDFSVAFQARQVLVRLTRRDAGFDAASWTTLLDELADSSEGA
jgi:hypothetical protein